MLTNIWEALKLIVSYGDRLTRAEKELHDLRTENKSLVKDLIALALKVERMAERENWRDEKLRQEKEIERLRLELERQRHLLPPGPAKADPEESPSKVPPDESK